MFAMFGQSIYSHLTVSSSIQGILSSMEKSRWFVPIWTPDSITDDLFARCLLEIFLSRPHAIVPVIWEPIEHVHIKEEVRETLDQILRVVNPLCWPGDGGSDAAKDEFWRKLFQRTTSEDTEMERMTANDDEGLINELAEAE